ncbi:response regulator [bacterium]|nr:response regulator [bacterium]
MSHATAVASHVGISPRTGKILVIDDEENIRATLEEFLTLTGYRVTTAANGAEGLDRLGAASFDLVLSDLKMPGVDGIAVIEWVKETQPDLPVVVMTGFATVDSTIRALRLGAEDYLLKPFSLDEIERTIESCLEKRRLREENTELTAANERLREIERIKDDLLATVSHEFRTPLTAMKGFLSLMRLTDQDNLRSDQLHALQALNDNAERLDLMICNLLTLVEAQDGAYRPILEPSKIGPFLTEVVETLAETHELGAMEVDVPEDVAETEVLLDRIRFPLALSNLIDNAFKFYATPGETEVILRARVEERHVVLEVHDNGIGIADSLGERVFERFMQGDMSATREFQGVGLGLAVVQVIVAAHNGKVRLVPPVLGGASVRITLPRMERH